MTLRLARPLSVRRGYIFAHEQYLVMFLVNICLADPNLVDPHEDCFFSIAERPQRFLRMARFIESEAIELKARSWWDLQHDTTRLHRWELIRACWEPARISQYRQVLREGLELHENHAGCLTFGILERESVACRPCRMGSLRSLWARTLRQPFWKKHLFQAFACTNHSSSLLHVGALESTNTPPPTRAAFLVRNSRPSSRAAAFFQE